MYINIRLFNTCLNFFIKKEQEEKFGHWEKKTEFEYLLVICNNKTGRKNGKHNPRITLNLSSSNRRRIDITE